MSDAIALIVIIIPTNQKTASILPYVCLRYPANTGPKAENIAAPVNIREVAEPSVPLFAESSAVANIIGFTVYKTVPKRARIIVSIMPVPKGINKNTNIAVEAIAKKIIGLLPFLSEIMPITGADITPNRVSSDKWKPAVNEPNPRSSTIYIIRNIDNELWDIPRIPDNRTMERTALFFNKGITATKYSLIFNESPAMLDLFLKKMATKIAHKATGILMNNERDSHFIGSVLRNERLIPP